MTISKKNEMTVQYSTPKCKVVKTMVNRAIMAVSGGDSFSVDNLTEEDW